MICKQPFDISECMSFEQIQACHLYRILFEYNEIFDRCRIRIGDEAFRNDMAALTEELHWHDEDNEAFYLARDRYKKKIGSIYDEDFIESLIFYYESYFNLLPDDIGIEGLMNDGETSAENL